MKLSKTSLIAIVVGVVVIVGVLLGTTKTQQNSQEQTLEGNLNTAKQRLAAISNDSLVQQKDLLTQQISQYNAEIRDKRTLLTFPDDSIKVTESIMEDARIHQVDISSINSSGLSQSSLAGTDCGTLTLTLTASGTTENIADFIYSFSEIFPTSILQSVNVSMVPPTPTPVTTPESTPTPTTSPSPSPTIITVTPTVPEKTTVNISLIIFNYKGE